MKNNSSNAFSLIELLLVIAIAGILTFLILLYVLGYMGRTRNSVRYNDADHLKNGLEYYKLNNGSYPQSSGWVKLEEDDISNGNVSKALRKEMKNIPHDPSFPKVLDTQVYSYQYSSTTDGQGYKLHIDMENGAANEVSVNGDSLVYTPPGGGGGGTPNPSGNALQFNGTNSYLDIPATASLNITDQISIEAWVKIDTVSPRPDYATVIAKKCSYTECYGFLVYQDQSTIAFYVQNGGVSYANATIPRDQWVHVVGTYDRTSPNNIDLYYDGVLLGNGPVPTGAIHTSALNAVMAGNTDPSNTYSPYYFKGTLDGVRIYGKRLNETVVAQHYQGDFSHDNDGCGGASCDLRAAWNFDEGSGNTTADSSGNGNTATLINNPQWVVAP